ncbi:HAMP domain-containing sensor histidine kinase [Luedemannella helvata]|uniref:Signal transduction histidine-protein kinase/phosphatase MprB n=1 Tax=Luedemannella helvata TaxID=349315 RepID=A0ABN2K4I3_9ACTN
MIRRFAGLATLITCAVAVVSVVITALVALPLVVRAAESQSRAALAEKAQVAAEAIEGRATAMAAVRERQRAEKIARTLRAQGLDAIVVIDGSPDQAGVPPKVLNALRAGKGFSGHGRYNGRAVLIEARAVSAGTGIVLLRPASEVGVRAIAARLWIALAAGLLAGLGAGVLLARLLARPIRRAAGAARRLSAGDRGVRLPVTPPDEVADLAHALNDLAAALATSEGRQRAFLMSISHELRTPLTTLKGYAEALADGVVDPDATRRTGETMLAEASRLDRLVADLLALARLEADDFPLSVAPVDVADLVGGAAEAWAARCADAGVLLRVESPGSMPPVPTDAMRVRQVVDGLLENALRVVPPGAPIVLACGLGSGSDSGSGSGSGSDEPTVPLPILGGRAAVAPWAGRAHVVLEVRDGGPGLTDDDLAVAFERGALHERYQGVRKVGSGLGLALAARLVHRLGGQISVGHAAEGGARFVVRLPYEPRT